MRSKSSSFHSTPAEWAIAKKCRTALVEPPTAITTEIAFSIDLRVMISRGNILLRMALTRILPASSVFSPFSGATADMVEEYIGLIPIASKAEDMVLAVYIPPQEPAPGQALRSTDINLTSSIRPALYCPTASKALTTVRSSPSKCPGSIVPP